MGDHLLFGLSEVRIIGRDQAATPESHTRNTARRRVRHEVTHHAVDIVHVLRHLLQQEDMPLEVREMRRTDQSRQDREIERNAFCAKPWSTGTRLPVPHHQKIDRSRHGDVTTGTRNVCRHWTVGNMANLVPVKCPQQAAKITVPKEQFPTRCWPKVGKHLIDDPIGSVPSSREPYGREGGIICNLDKRRRPRRIRARKMSFSQKTLRMEDDLDPVAMTGHSQRGDPLGRPLVHPAGRSDNANPDGLPRRPNHLQTRHALCDELR
jgi:hypothetical protein